MTGTDDIMWEGHTHDMKGEGSKHTEYLLSQVPTTLL